MGTQKGETMCSCGDVLKILAARDPQLEKLVKMREELWSWIDFRNRAKHAKSLVELEKVILDYMLWMYRTYGARTFTAREIAHKYSGLNIDGNKVRKILNRLVKKGILVKREVNEPDSPWKYEYYLVPEKVIGND